MLSPPPDPSKPAMIEPPTCWGDEDLPGEPAPHDRGDAWEHPADRIGATPANGQAPPADDQGEHDDPATMAADTADQATADGYAVEPDHDPGDRQVNRGVHLASTDDAHVPADQGEPDDDRGEAAEAPPSEQPAEDSDEPANTSDIPNPTDLGNARLLVKDHGQDLRYCHPWKKWLIWSAKRWRIDDTGEVTRRAKATVKRMYRIAAALLKSAQDAGDDEKGKLTEKAKKLLTHAIKSEDARALGRMIELAKSEPGIPVLPGDLDRCPWTFNVDNGTLDLRAGKLRPHRREDMLTKLCPTPYHAGAKCPRFEAAILTILASDRELVTFTQRYLGYSLTGDIREQSILLWHGSGANGKTVTENAVITTIGDDYGGVVPPDLLLDGRDQHPTIIASLLGKRLLFAAETGQGRRLNEERLKALTGGDKLSARRMREDFWEFNPTHKLIVVTNHRPEVRGQDHAVWRRLRLVPFAVQFLDPGAPENSGKQIPADRRIDRGLAAALLQERPGILAWLVRGCLDWQANGMPTAAVVSAATAAYRADEDIIGTFLAECCLTGGTDYRVRSGALYGAFAKWAEASGERPMTAKAFGNTIGDKGFERFRSNGWWYRGVALSAE